MHHTQKLVLLPLEDWEKIKDKHMKEVKQVTVPLQKVVKSPVVKVQTPSFQKGTGKILKKNQVEKKLKWMIECLTPEKSNKAQTLLRYIEKDNNMTWNDDGEFEYKGKVIQNSDIKKLIIHTLWNNNKTDIKGLKIFYQALSSLNLPKHLITNKIGRSIMKETRRKCDDKWRPPGKLYKK